MAQSLMSLAPTDLQIEEALSVISAALAARAKDNDLMFSYVDEIQGQLLADRLRTMEFLRCRQICDDRYIARYLLADDPTRYILFTNAALQAAILALAPLRDAEDYRDGAREIAVDALLENGARCLPPWWTPEKPYAAIGEDGSILVTTELSGVFRKPNPPVVRYRTVDLTTGNVIPFGRP